MKKTSIVALLGFGALAAFFFLAPGRGASVTLSPFTLVTIPNRGRCIEFHLKNNSNAQIGCSFYRQQLFAGRWKPEVPTRFRPDEVLYLPAGAGRVASFRVHESGGTYRFQVQYGRPISRLRRFVALLRLKFRWGHRTEMLHGTHESFTTVTIHVPPA
jgi:hypothetical protein